MSPNRAQKKEGRLSTDRCADAVRDRTVRVVAEASGQRAVIEPIGADGRPFRSVVKWANLAGLNDQLF
jgi:hypothetical protein